MIYILLFALLFLFIAFYQLLGKDVFQPSCIVIASYIVCTLCAIINQDLWGVAIHSQTLIVLCLGIISFAGVSFIANNLKNTHIGIGRYSTLDTENKFSSEACVQVDSIVLAFVIVGQLIALVIYYREIVRITGGGSSFSAMMNTFRMETSYSTDDISVSGIAGQLSKLSLICAEVFMYIFVNNIVKSGMNGNKRYLLPVLVHIVQAIFTGGRFNLIIIICAGIMFYNVLWHQKNGWRSHLETKSLLKIVIVICAALIGFYYLRILVGRQNDQDLITYIASYIGGSIPLFDMFLTNPPEASTIFGKETFYSLLEDLNQLGILDTQSYIMHLEFRSSNGIEIGNVYTGLRRNIQDFGIFGMVILQMICGAFMTRYYNKLKDNGSNLAIIVYGVISYTLFLHGINDCFYLGVVSIGFIVQIVEIYVVYKIVTQVKFTWGGV